MSHHHGENEQRIVSFNAQQIAPVELMPHLRKAEELLYKATLYFFSSERFSSNAPFKGFLIHGPVGTGKTELVKQVARRVSFSLKESTTIRFVPVDSAVIASPRWGESEQVFQNLFGMVRELNQISNDAKVIMLFDDIESLLLARGMTAAREWHYSLNSVFFHLLDNMNPYQNMVFATTNRIDLMDPAVTTRLYSVEVSNVPLKELMNYASKMLDSMLGPVSNRNEILQDVESKLSALKTPTIRDCRQAAIISAIELGVLGEGEVVKASHAK